MRGRWDTLQKKLCGSETSVTMMVRSSVFIFVFQSFVCVFCSLSRYFSLFLSGIDRMHCTTLLRFIASLFLFLLIFLLILFVLLLLHRNQTVGIRESTTVGALKKLKPAFLKGGSATAGNSSQVIIRNRDGSYSLERGVEYSRIFSLYCVLNPQSYTRFTHRSNSSALHSCAIPVSITPVPSPCPPLYTSPRSICP
jgi:hypothetical protein